MNSLKHYIETARIRTGARSYSELSRMIGVTRNSLHDWQKGKSLPGAEKMAKLAELAGMSKELAIAELMAWGAVNRPSVYPLFKWMAEVAARAAKISGAVLLGALLAAPARTEAAQTVTSAGSSVYYGKFG